MGFAMAREMSATPALTSTMHRTSAVRNVCEVPAAISSDASMLFVNDSCFEVANLSSIWRTIWKLSSAFRK